MAPRKVRAKYRTVGPRMETVTYEKNWLDEETKSLQRETVSEEMKCWYVFFPHGHSIRLCGENGFKELQRMGYHIKPRLVDMETGDVVELGGDPYNFMSGETDEDDADNILLDDSEEPGLTGTRNRTRRQAQNAT